MTTNISKLPLFMRLTFAIPLWLDHILLRNTILDGDNVFLHFQEHHLAEESRAMERDTRKTSNNSNGNAMAWRKEYFMPTRADTLVAAFKNWLDVAGKGGPFGPLHRCANHSLITDHRVLLDRYEQHTKNCPACRSALSWVERLRALSAVIAAIGLGAAVSSVIQTAPAKTVAMCGVFGLLGALAWQGLSMLRAQFYFVDYDHATR